MAVRFPLYTDENVKGALIKALRQGGWDVVRAIEVFPEGTDDEVHLAFAFPVIEAVLLLAGSGDAVGRTYLAAGRR